MPLAEAATAPLHTPLAAPEAAWQARLRLGFARRGTATVLVRREHLGPLRMQKALYPEGDGVCHAILLHPPSGVAGGDELDIGASLDEGAHALLTTPGAGKWYRTAGPWAGQRLHFEVGAGGTLEWLPQETIVFNGARAALQTRIDLAADARCIGWEVLCLGRRASGERFDAGEIRLDTRVTRQGRPIWLERGLLGGGSPLLHSPAGLAGFSVSATLFACAAAIDAALLAACREIGCREPEARTGITALPDLILARYLGHSSEAARDWFAALWRVLRPGLLGCAARTPRIWHT